MRQGRHRGKASGKEGLRLGDVRIETLNPKPLSVNPKRLSAFRNMGFKKLRFGLGGWDWGLGVKD